MKGETRIQTRQDLRSKMKYSLNYTDISLSPASDRRMVLRRK